jgi:RNA 2',3'-cyclic 3'-phosphodiesterase
MEKKRLFLAFTINPVEPAAERMKLLQNQLRAYRIKWVSVDNFHLTLLFFGELPMQKTDSLQKLLHQVLKRSSAFTFSLTGPGIFRNRKEPRVLWLGIEATDELVKLKKEIDKAVTHLGFIPDNKVFCPHLTLGRFAPRQKVSPALYTALKKMQITKPFTYYVSKLILFESKLSPTGPRHYPIDVFPLMPEDKKI